MLLSAHKDLLTVHRLCVCFQIHPPLVIPLKDTTTMLTMMKCPGELSQVFFSILPNQPEVEHNRDFVNTRLLVHKHVKISVDEWILETTRPHKHVTIFRKFLSIFFFRTKLEYYFQITFQLFFSHFLIKIYVAKPGVGIQC